MKLIIIADESHISLETEGPVRGKDGILALLDAARELAEQVTPDPRS